MDIYKRRSLSIKGLIHNQRLDERNLYTMFTDQEKQIMLFEYLG